MKYSVISMIFIFGLFLCAAPLFAANVGSDALAKDPISGLSAAQAVNMGVDKFSDRYEKITKDESNAGICNAFITFSQLRRYINDRGAAKRPKAQQTLIKQIRTCCTDITTAYI